MLHGEAAAPVFEEQGSQGRSGQNVTASPAEVRARLLAEADPINAGGLFKSSTAGDCEDLALRHTDTELYTLTCVDIQIMRSSDCLAYLNSLSSSLMLPYRLPHWHIGLGQALKGRTFSHTCTNTLFTQSAPSGHHLLTYPLNMMQR